MTRMSRCKAASNLATDEVLRVVEAPAAVVVGDAYPASADHDEHYVAGRDGTADEFDEIITRRYGIYSL